MTDLSGADGNATPLSPVERDGLIPTHITLRSELNELEQKNVAEADRWAFSRKRKVLDEVFLQSLHRRMFNRVWRWAGIYRQTERNLGVASHLIQPELRRAMDDIRYWLEHKSFPSDEIAIRLHHRLVVVHPFPNGNGRWSRLAADLLVVQQGGLRFTWGGADLQSKGDMRAVYIDVLKKADQHDLAPLVRFARS